MLERVNDEFEAVFGKRYAITSRILKSGMEFWLLSVYRRDIFEFFAVNTANRTLVPDAYFRASDDVKRRLIGGMMDSDGYISERVHDTFTQWTVGFANTNRGMVEAVASILRSMGVKVGIIGETKKGDYRTVYRIGPNMKTFAQAGPFFHVQRKKEKFDRCIAYLSGSETMYAAPGTSGEDIVQHAAKAV